MCGENYEMALLRTRKKGEAFEATTNPYCVLHLQAPFCSIKRGGSKLINYALFFAKFCIYQAQGKHGRWSPD